MSALSAHATAARLTAKAFHDQALALPPSVVRDVIDNIGHAYAGAADEMVAQILADCTGTDGRVP